MNSYRSFKRFLDLLGIILLLPLILPLLTILLFIHIIFVRRPYFFLQERLGKAGKPFVIYKLRTLEEDNDISSWTSFLRMSHLDELPQLLNIVKGEMSFIGPRPLITAYYSYFTAIELDRFTVKPGLTGLAQIKGGNHLSWDKRLALDVEYAINLTFLADLKIFIKTFKIIFNLDGTASVSLSEERGYRNKSLL